MSDGAGTVTMHVIRLGLDSRQRSDNGTECVPLKSGDLETLWLAEHSRCTAGANKIHR